MDETPLADIVIGWCWIKHGNTWSTSFGQFDDNQHVKWWGTGEMLEDNPEAKPKFIPRLGSGFPCVLMRREVLERLGHLAFSCIPKADVPYGRLGEDFSFFWRAHEAGMRCYLDPLCKVGHIKPEMQEPDFVIPAGGSLPPVLEMWRHQKNGDRVEVPMSG
jgi:GT2 family glycosyltransferase